VLIVSLLSLVLGGAGCDRRGRGDGRDPDTLPPPPKTTSTTAPSFDVPAVIDAAYVGRVMQALDHVYGDGVRHLAVSRSVDEEFLKHLLAIYTDRFFQLAQDAWVKESARGFPTLAQSPGDPLTRIQSIVRNDRDCVVAQVTHDFSALRTSPPAPTPQRYIALISKPSNRDPDGLNPTPWAMTYDGYPQSDTVPEDPCRPV
jgi:hypothetical protein